MRRKNDINYKSIGRNIRALRISRQMTQEQLADKLSLSISHVRNVESSNAKISLPTLIKLANIFDVSTDSILCESLNNRNRAMDCMYLESIRGCNERQLKIIIETIKTLKFELSNNI